MEYQVISDESKQAVLRELIGQAETEHYSMTVTVQLAESLAKDSNTSQEAKAQYAQQAVIAARRIRELTSQIEKYHELYNDLNHK
jgi:LytS/YehU family sensor histidine kinase